MSIQLQSKPETKAVEHHARLSSAEVANLWTQYMTDTLARCFIHHALRHASDRDVRSMLETALDLSLAHIEKIESFLSQEDYAIPQGFTLERDVINPDAPALFTDMFLLQYFYVMTLLGLTSYAGALSTSTRPDQREYFSQCNRESMELFNQISDIMLEKGIANRSPHVYPPQEVDFVEQQGYLAGWFGRREPLNAIEISSLYFNMVKIELKVALESAFGQVVQSEDIRKYMQRGKKLCQEQFHDLGLNLAENDLPLPRRLESEVTDSTTPPFSDKFMLYHIVTLISASAAFYGAGLSVSQRRDLAAKYTAMIAQMGLYAEDGVNLLIDKAWMERPPAAVDRKALKQQTKG